MPSGNCFLHTKPDIIASLISISFLPKKSVFFLKDCYDFYINMFCIVWGWKLVSAELTLSLSRECAIISFYLEHGRQA